MLSACDGPNYVLLVLEPAELRKVFISNAPRSRATSSEASSEDEYATAQEGRQDEEMLRRLLKTSERRRKAAEKEVGDYKEKLAACTRQLEAVTLELRETNAKIKPEKGAPVVKQKGTPVVKQEKGTLAVKKDEEPCVATIISPHHSHSYILYPVEEASMPNRQGPFGSSANLSVRP